MLSFLTHRLFALGSQACLRRENPEGELPIMVAKVYPKMPAGTLWRGDKLVIIYFAYLSLLFLVLLFSGGKGEAQAVQAIEKSFLPL